MAARRSRAAPKTDRPGLAFEIVWHLAWALAVIAGGALMADAGHLAPHIGVTALGVGLAPAVIGALLAATGQPSARLAAILVWGLASALACQMTGGTVGPLAVWCLAPLAAASAFRVPRLIAVGAAASFAAAAVAALGTALLPLPTPPQESHLWLSLIALITTALGLGSGLMAMQGAERGRANASDLRERGLRAVLRHQPQLLMNLDTDGAVLETFGEAPSGVDAYDLTGRNLAHLAAADERPRLQAALRRADEALQAHVAFTPAYDPEGWLILDLRRMGRGHLAAALRDGGLQHAREAQLEEARIAAEAQNAGKSRFLANMSHELRTPLNAIMGFSDIMRQRLFGPIADRYAEYAQLIHESGSHLLELINDVLDMSKIEAERYELAREGFDARDAIAAVLRLMRGQAERAGIHLRGVIPNQPLEVEADRRAVKQIALNLISNALKFTPRGGAVTVTIQACGDVLELVVADSGVGIAPDDLARLGTPFEQAGDADQRAAGSGLGLSLVRAFARLHGGDMAMESVVGEGTSVTVRMPVLAEPLPLAAQG